MHDLQAIIRSHIADSELTNSELEYNREQAMRYYLGGLLGNERAGRSQVVMTEVRDTIDWMLPSLTEVFCGERSAVQFTPRHDDPENAAKIETAYCNWVINTKNDGFMIVNNWLQDGLLMKNGYVKAFWKRCTTQEEERYMHQNPMEAQILMEDQSFEITSMDPVDDQGSAYNVVGRRKKNYGKIEVQNIPPENVLVHRDWRQLDLQNCPFVAHYEEMTQSDLISQGFDPELVMGLPFAGGGQESDVVDIYRRRDIDGGTTWTGGSGDKSTDTIAIYECYLLVDLDMDGIVERRKVVYESTSGAILLNELTDHVPILAWTPSPMAHRHYGTSIFDRVMEIQNIKTAIMRQMLDNLYLANNPRTVVNSQRVEMADILSPAIGSPIRLKNGGSISDIQSFAVPFIANQSMPIMDYLDATREQRTGVSRQSQGLDPSSLKDQSIYGMSTLMEAATQKIRYIARVFGETGFKQLMILIRMLAAKYADDAEIFGVAGEFSKTDPRQWTKERDVYVTVGVGNAAPDLRMRALQMIQVLQEKVIAAQGGATAGNAAVMVDATNAYNSIADTLEAMGIYNVSRYFKNPAPIMPQLNEMANQPPPPDPAVEVAKEELEIKAQTELNKQQVEMAQHQDKMDLERQRIALDRQKLVLEEQKIKQGK